MGSRVCTPQILFKIHVYACQTLVVSEDSQWSCVPWCNYKKQNEIHKAQDRHFDVISFSYDEHLKSRVLSKHVITWFYCFTWVKTSKYRRLMTFLVFILCSAGALKPSWHVICRYLCVYLRVVYVCAFSLNRHAGLHLCRYVCLRSSTDM